jgi:hypothetical protein
MVLVRDSANTLWEQDPRTELWTTYLPVSSHRRTRRSARIYMNGVYQQNAPARESLFPATISRELEVLTASVSTSVFPLSMPVQPRDLWQHADVPPALHDTPPFYQHLLNLPLSASQCEDIATTLADGHLAACSDGAYDPTVAVASHGVVFTDSPLHSTIATCTGPVDRHPHLLSSYHAELTGIIAFLYLIYRVCQYYNITSGTAKIFCDNKGALRNAFHEPKAGITPYFDTDYDMVTLAQSLIQVIPVTISSEWVK